MATLTLTLTPADLIAALQAWVSSPTGGSVTTPTNPHQMNATVAPITANNGGMIVELNN